MTSYIVHYSDGGPDMMRAVSPPSTSYDITGLTNGANYTISVEATSQHLSGESEEMTISLGECFLNSISATSKKDHPVR